MADLIVLMPNHGYADNTALFCSWLGGTFNVDDPTADSFKLTDGAAGTNVEHTTTVIDGFVREVSTGITEITGLGHLEGQSVYVTADGELVGLFTVTNGAITVLAEIFTYQVGKAFGYKVKTMRFAVPGGRNVQTRIKRISETSLRYIRSKGGQAGQEYDDTEYVGDLDTTFSTKSKDVSILTKGGFSEDGVSIIKGSLPFPFTGLGLVTEVEIWER